MQRHDIVIFSRLGAKKLRSRRGFTLVEVVISLGIVAFGMVSMMGLLPVGLSTFRQAKTNTVESQIVQGLANNVVLTDFSKLSDLARDKYFYDAEGKLLSGVSKGFYEVSVTLETMKDPQLDAIVLQATNAAGNSVPEAYNVKINIINTTEPLKPRVYSVVMANLNSTLSQ